MRWQPSFFFTLCLLSLLCTHCGEPERPTARPSQATTLAAKSAQVVFLTDLGGYLEPCGCQSTSLGGLDRTATRLAELRKEFPDLITVAAGDLLFEDGSLHQRSDDDARAQELWKSETLVDILSQLPVDVAFFGQGDLRFGSDAYSSAVGHARFPHFGPATRAGPAPPSTFQARVGTMSVSLVFAELAPEGEIPLSMMTKAARAARAGGAVMVIAVVHGEYRQARQLAAQTTEFDFLVATGRDSDDPTPPEKIGSTVLLTGGRHGRGLLLLDARVTQAGAAFTDHSAWSREAEQAGLKRTIDHLVQRIADWKADPKVDASQVAKQEERLAKLKGDLHAAPDVDGQNSFDVRYLPITQDVTGAQPVTEQMAAYDAKVNAHNRKAFADRVPRKAGPKEASYVGSQACSGCHAEAYRWWQGHAHGRAYDTLVSRNKQYNLSCVGCHVTGYEKPGGSTVTHNEGLVHVGCESCHGPGSLHLADRSKILAAPGESVCVQCHNSEHSDQFDFAIYRARLLAPGHGRPSETDQPVVRE